VAKQVAGDQPLRIAALRQVLCSSDCPASLSSQAMAMEGVRNKGPVGTQAEDKAESGVENEPSVSDDLTLVKAVSKTAIVGISGNDSAVVPSGQCSGLIGSNSAGASRVDATLMTPSSTGQHHQQVFSGPYVIGRITFPLLLSVVGVVLLNTPTSEFGLQKIGAIVMYFSLFWLAYGIIRMNYVCPHFRLSFNLEFERGKGKALGN
jgi:hypothetical protein